MTGFDPDQAFSDAERQLLDAFVVPDPSHEWASKVIASTESDSTALPRLRPAGRRRWRRLPIVALACAGGLVTAAVAQQGAFGPVVKQRVQSVVSATFGLPSPKTLPATTVAVSSKAQPIPVVAEPMPVAKPSLPGPERIAPVIEKLKANPTTADKVNRFLERRESHLGAGAQAAAIPDIKELARRYRQLSPERKRELRHQLRALPPEDQAEIRAIIRDYRNGRQTQSVPGDGEPADALGQR